MKLVRVAVTHIVVRRHSDNEHTYVAERRTDAQRMCVYVCFIRSSYADIYVKRTWNSSRVSLCVCVHVSADVRVRILEVDAR